MGDGGASVMRLASSSEEPSNTFILFSSPFSSFPPLTVCAPAALLARVPYFATQLAKPWIASSHQQKIALQCTSGSSPHDYVQCLRLLTSAPTSWPHLLASVSKVLQILPVADHLLFQDCWDTCMAVLASSPWSIDEEDAIRATISNLNMEPSPDVKERLDTSHDAAALEILFHKMLSTPSLEASFVTWCQKCLNHSSAPFAAAFHSILLKVMESFWPRCRIMPLLPREWYVLAKIFLQFTDAQQFILYLVNSEDLLQILASSLSITLRQRDACHVVKQVLEKVEKRVVLLSNLQRARLVKWLKYGSGSPQHYMRLRLAETLPFSDAARKDVVVTNTEVIPYWIDQVSHRISQMDEAGLKIVCKKFEEKLDNSDDILRWASKKSNKLCQP